MNPYCVEDKWIHDDKYRERYLTLEYVSFQFAAFLRSIRSFPPQISHITFSLYIYLALSYHYNLTLTYLLSLCCAVRRYQRKNEIRVDTLLSNVFFIYPLYTTRIYNAKNVIIVGIQQQQQ